MKNYETVSEAIEGLKKRGYTGDFNIGLDGVQSHKSAFSLTLAPDKFLITEVYGFEGETGPDDEAVVYAIESRDRYKGILVNDYDISSDPVNAEMIKKLMIKHQVMDLFSII